MINRKHFLFWIFFIFLINNIHGQIINKVIYNKTVLSYSESVLITVYLEELDVKDVIIFFNDKEIYNINKNLIDNKVLYSVSFEVSNIKYENNLQIYFILNQGITISESQKIIINRGLIITNNNFQIKKDKIFFIVIGSNDNKLKYKIKIDNNIALIPIGEVVENNIIYYKFKTVDSGNANISILNDNAAKAISLLKNLNIHIVD